MPIEPLPRERFAIFALSLPEGPNFDPLIEVSWWSAKGSSSVGVVTYDPRNGCFGGAALRRNTDHRFVTMSPVTGFQDAEHALLALTDAMRPEAPPESIRPGTRRRPKLFDVSKDSGLNPKFDLLRSTWSHYAALMTIGEIYLALDRPDANFVPDFQTEGFDGRLWELYLFAAFREQAIRVSQAYPSPDFKLERDGLTLFVEAVTANSDGGRLQPLALPQPAPEDLDERTLGAPAARFAKSLKSKMERRYWDLPYVVNHPFALAIGDFHQPGSMTWSLQALQSYLYGLRTVTEHDESGTKRAWAEPVSQLRSVQPIPAGLFRQPDARHVSAVIGSNAGTLSKFNRMGYLAGWKPPGISMERSGIFFSYEGDRLEPKDFSFDLADPAYQQLWPFGECWCQELEVYHNPQALHPIPREFFPGATHFFERDGDMMFEGPWKNRVLSSVTLVKAAQC